MKLTYDMYRNVCETLKEQSNGVQEMIAQMFE